MLISSSLLLLLHLLPGQAPAARATDIVQVPIEMTEIKENSLIADAAIAKNNETIATAAGLERTGLPNGARLYALIVLPGQVLEVQRHTDSESQIMMRLVPPRRPNAMTTEIERINRQPKAVRSKRMEISNPSKTDGYKVLLQVFGSVNVPYRLTMTRRMEGK